MACRNPSPTMAWACVNRYAKSGPTTSEIFLFSHFNPAYSQRLLPLRLARETRLYTRTRDTQSKLLTTDLRIVMVTSYKSRKDFAEILRRFLEKHESEACSGQNRRFLQ